MIPEHDMYEAYMNADKQDRQINLLFSGQAYPQPDHKIGPSVHDYYLLHSVLEGRGKFESGGVIYDCRPGDTFVIFPGSLFSYQADTMKPWHYAWVALQGPGVFGQLAEIGITPTAPVVRSGHVVALRELYMKIRLALQPGADPRLESLEASGWLLLLFHHFGRAHREATPASDLKEMAMIDRQVEQAIRWFSLQYQQQLSIEELARQLGYHRAHLFHAFKARTGLSPKQYLMKVRMDKAKQLLTGVALTVDQIASSVGFNDALYFSRQFRKITGMSPSEYRSQAGKSDSI